MNERPTYLDLFSGIGGFALAARWAGFRTIGFCEIDGYCRKVLAKNFLADASFATKSVRDNERKEHQPDIGTALRDFNSSGCPRLHENIFDLNGRDFYGVDLITGGFPCQPFSVAGKRRGAADDRAIWPEMFRVISEARPAWVLVENVPGIIPMELDNVLSDLEGIGYAARPFNIGAVSVDARHRRQRIWIIGRNMAYSAQQRDRRICDNGDSGQHHESQRQSGGNSVCSPLPNTSSEGLEGQRNTIRAGTELCNTGDHCRWLPEPDVGRVAHGVRSRVDRLKSLGNAIVPQVAFEILREIRKLI